MKLIDTKANNNPLISAQHESAVSLNKVSAVVGMWLNHRNKLWHVVLSKAAMQRYQSHFFYYYYYLIYNKFLLTKKHSCTFIVNQKLAS